MISIPNIPKLPTWFPVAGSLAFSSVLLVGMLVGMIELNMALDCSLIGTSEDSKLTEEEVIQYREACERTGDDSYVLIFLVVPIMIVLMVVVPFGVEWYKQRGKKQ